MSIIESSRIISKQVLDVNTGELVYTNFREEKIRSGLRGGFRMVYVEFDTAMLEVVASRLDYEIAIGIRELYTKKQTEVHLKKKELSELFNTSEDKVVKVIARMVSANLLLRVSRGTYRFNPFMYLPMMAPGAELQREWNQICKDQVHEMLADKETTDIDRGNLTQDIIASKLGEHGFMKLIANGLKASMSMEDKWRVFDSVVEQ